MVLQERKRWSQLVNVLTDWHDCFWTVPSVNLPKSITFLLRPFTPTVLLKHCYHGDAAIVFLWLGFHGDERCTVLPQLPSPPHPRLPQISPAGNEHTALNQAAGLSSDGIFWSINPLQLQTFVYLHSPFLHWHLIDLFVIIMGLGCLKWYKVCVVLFFHHMYHNQTKCVQMWLFTTWCSASKSWKTFIQVPAFINNMSSVIGLLWFWGCSPWKRFMVSLYNIYMNEHQR